MALPFSVLLASRGDLFCASGAQSAAVSRARVIPAESDAPEFMRRMLFCAWLRSFSPLTLDGHFYSLEGHSHNPEGPFSFLHDKP